MGMFGLLGPNGAGKSSLMRTIATLQEADSGSIRMGDVDVLRDKEAMRARLGYLPQAFGVYPGLSAVSLLEHIAILKGLAERRQRREAVDHLLQQVNLFEARHKAVSSFSGGMRQRFGVAQALLGQPSVVIVDEPTAGLDPAERVRFLNILSEVSQRAAIILSTHIVEDVSELCSQMAIIASGQVILSGEPQALIERLEGQVWQTLVPREALPRYEESHRVISTRFVAGRIALNAFGTQSPGDEFSPAAADLKDVYFCALKGWLPAPSAAD
ncbi:MAG: ABC transporter ATP-binding protein [Thiohalocapsa sp.]|nr:ABC transporter ATP-binding protein [Thiohalocapsa sp.]